MPKNGTRCKWCNNACYDDFCCPECGRSYERFESFANRYAVWFYLGVLGPIALVFGAIVTLNAGPWMGAMLLIEGITFTALPFATPETDQAWGVKRSARVVRIFGLVFIGAGTALILSSI